MKSPATWLVTIAFISATSITALLGQSENAQAERTRRERTTLQQAFTRFQRLEVKQTAEGSLQLQSVILNRDPLIIDGARYDGFRIKVARTGEGWNKLKQNLVWGFIPPTNLDSWSIVPEHGAMNGFQDFNRLKRTEAPKFREAEPLSIANVIIQTLDGRYLVEDQEYLIFFLFKNDEVARFSIALGFSHLQAEEVVPSDQGQTHWETASEGAHVYETPNGRYKDVIDEGERYEILERTKNESGNVCDRIRSEKPFREAGSSEGWICYKSSDEDMESFAGLMLMGGVINTSMKPPPFPRQQAGEPSNDLAKNRLGARYLDGERFPQTRTRLITEAEAAAMSYADLRYAINETYARHGTDFPTQPAIAKRFQPFEWYHPRRGVSMSEIENEFSEIERTNVKLLATYRDQRRAAGER